MKRTKLKLDEYTLKKIEELAANALNKNEIACMIGVSATEYSLKEAANPSMDLAFEIGKRKMVGRLAKKMLKIAYSDDKESFAACKYLLTVKDFKNWSEKYQEREHGVIQEQALPKINFLISEEYKDVIAKTGGNKSA